MGEDWDFFLTLNIIYACSSFRKWKENFSVTRLYFTCLTVLDWWISYFQVACKYQKMLDNDTQEYENSVIPMKNKCYSKHQLNSGMEENRSIRN